MRPFGATGAVSNYVFVSLLGRAANIGSVLLMAKSMDAAHFGTFAFFQSTAGVTLTLGTLSLPTTIGVIISRGEPHRVPLENALLTVLLGALSVFCAVIAVLVIALSRPETMTSAAEWLLFAGFVAVSCLQSLAQAVLFARGQPLWSSTSLALSAGLLFLGVYLFKPGSTLAALTLSSAAILISVIFAAVRIFSRGLLIDRARVGAEGMSFLRRRGIELLRFSFFALVSSVIFQAAIWFLQLRLISVAGAAANAPFALGAQFYNVVIFLPSIFGPVLLRRMSREDDHRTQEREAVLATVGIAALCALGLVVFHFVEPLILAILPARYGQFIDTIRWGVIAGAFMFVKFPLSVFFQARLSAVPDAIANFLAAALMVGGAMFAFWSGSPTRSMELRSLGHCLQFGSIVVSFFLVWLQARRPSVPS